MRKLQQFYVCRRCGGQYSDEDYAEDRFCRNCGTFLLRKRGYSRPVPQRAEDIHGDNPNLATLKSSLAVEFPNGYEERQEQLEFIASSSEALKNHQVFIGSAPCGIGKSLAALLTIIPKLKAGKLLICFRTRSQLHIFLEELKKLNSGLQAISFFSKRDMCPRLRSKISYLDFFDECRRLKENSEIPTKPYCEFYRRMLKKKKYASDLAKDCAARLLSPSEAVKHMSKAGFCAYEALKRILSDAAIFLGTYHYVFDPHVRAATLKDFSNDLSEAYLIVDEAHNLPKFSRELLSDSITRNSILGALRESADFPEDESKLIQECLETLDDEIFDKALKNLMDERPHLINPDDVDALLLENGGVSGLEAAEILSNYGRRIIELKKESGRERIFSFNRRVGEFLSNFVGKVGENHIHLIKKESNGTVALHVKSFDGREVTDPILRSVKGSILMSGYLSPPNVYRDLLLYEADKVYLKEFDSPFPAENRLILVATDVSSRYQMRTAETLVKWKNYIEKISDVNQGNVAAFFTSYRMLAELDSIIDTHRRKIMERSDTNREDVVKLLKGSKDNLLLGVMGGKFSEGIDYPQNILTSVVAVGLPYATWSVYQKALIDYFNMKFPSKGRTFAYVTPALLRLIQASGRVHRSPKDKGCIVILDRRVTTPRIKERLPTHLREEMITVTNPSECALHITRFWETQNPNPAPHYIR
ncbi:MAG: ATP-dependent DNA helicase [Candidatus Bathyarchaeota archaeon]|nr:MAG: ATP-dependent DNA helicase [Candidatus Bathyarchaeota archaeon]